MSLEELDKKLVSASENGQTISPILAEGVKNYLIDIDGTICDDIKNSNDFLLAVRVSHFKT